MNSTCPHRFPGAIIFTDNPMSIPSCLECSDINFKSEETRAMKTYYSKPQTGRVYYEHRKFKPVDEMNEGDTVAGVVYAAAAEQVIRKAFGEEHNPYQPTVIGYMVEVNDIDAVVEMENDEQWGLKGGVDDAKVDDEHDWRPPDCDCNPPCEVDDDKGEMDDGSRLTPCKFRGWESINIDRYRTAHGSFRCKPSDEWSQVDLDRKTVLINLPSLSQTELLELAAINRRLGMDVTK